MTFEEAKEAYETAEFVRLAKYLELERARQQTNIAYRKMKSLCPHENAKGLIIKSCPDCNHSDFFWAFNRLSGK